MATNNTITRRKYERDYCYMANEFLRDSRLSWKAKGIIAYVQMLPDDWVLNMRDLTNRATDGRDSLYSGIKELEKYGYCAKVMQRNPDGTIAGYAYEICDKSVFQPFTENPVTDVPQPENPCTVKPDTDKPGTENPTLINTNLTKDLNTLNTNPSNTPQNTFASLFPDETKVEEPKEKKTLFRNSDVYKMVKFENGVGVDYSEFESKFATPEFEKVDLVYYFHSVSDWSDQKNMKRTKNGWLATVRNFIRGDVEKKKLHLKPEYKAPTQRLNVAGAIEYLKDDY
ncbi:MAG: Replication initiator protein A (RepA) N-terminus [Bacteriophage sp.]|jgi:hypothetical protein|nr:MAG: Replication initiator protein A (RepA) N-terminus [Bacteriophage sp.]